MDQPSQPVLTIPTAILIAGAIIAGAVLWTKGPSVGPSLGQKEVDVLTENIKLVQADDHILGSPNAKVKIIEYSDPSCPYCKSFHNTMRQVMDTYGSTGNVAWIYRHYTLDKPDAMGNILHPNAAREAQALECANDLGGNDKFWKYTNRLYEITPSVTQTSPNGLDPKQLPIIASFAGLNVEDFNNCLATGKFKARVDADFTDGVNIGIQGTPSSIIVLEKALPVPIKEKLVQLYEPYKDQATGEYPIRISTDAKMIMLGGAFPFESIKATIELLFTY